MGKRRTRDEGEVYLPIPIAIVMENLEEISDAYDIAREQVDEYGAFRQATWEVLDPGQFDQVDRFIHGVADQGSAVAPEVGVRFRTDIVGKLETLYGQSRATGLLIDELEEDDVDWEMPPEVSCVNCGQPLIFYFQREIVHDEVIVGSRRWRDLDSTCFKIISSRERMLVFESLPTSAAAPPDLSLEDGIGVLYAPRPLPPG